MLDSGMGGVVLSFFLPRCPAAPLPRCPAAPLPRGPAYFNNPFAIVCSCMLLVPS
jgi:hypothetical protein